MRLIHIKISLFSDRFKILIPDSYRPGHISPLSDTELPYSYNISSFHSLINDFLPSAIDTYAISQRKKIRFPEKKQDAPVYLLLQCFYGKEFLWDVRRVAF